MTTWNVDGDHVPSTAEPYMCKQSTCNIECVFGIGRKAPPEIKTLIENRLGLGSGSGLWFERCIFSGFLAGFYPY